MNGATPTDAERALTVELGRRLRMLRRVSKRTEEEIASRARLPAQLIRSIECGQAEISMLAVRRIAGALGIASWVQIIEIAERRATGAQPAPARSSADGGLHIHVEINDEQAVAATLGALLAAVSADDFLRESGLERAHYKCDWPRRLPSEAGERKEDA